MHPQRRHSLSLERNRSKPPGPLRRRPSCHFSGLAVPMWPEKASIETISLHPDMVLTLAATIQVVLVKLTVVCYLITGQVLITCGVRWLKTRNTLCPLGSGNNPGLVNDHVFRSYCLVELNPICFLCVPISFGAGAPHSSRRFLQGGRTDCFLAYYYHYFNPLLTHLILLTC